MNNKIICAKPSHLIAKQPNYHNEQKSSGCHQHLPNGTAVTMWVNTMSALSI